MLIRGEFYVFFKEKSFFTLSSNEIFYFSRNWGSFSFFFRFIVGRVFILLVKGVKFVYGMLLLRAVRVISFYREDGDEEVYGDGD